MDIMAKRRINRTRSVWRAEPADPARRFRWQWLPHERADLVPFSPGNSGAMGGLQKLVNQLWQRTDDAGWCEVDAFQFERIKHYCRNYGPGGPNRLLRRICIPALRRTFGIDLSR